MEEYLSVFLLAMTPIGELRASIPVALGVHNMHWLTSYVISVFGNMIPPIFILLFLKKFLEFLSNRSKKFNKWLKKFWERQDKHSRLVRAYGFLGLIIIVSIPLPGTGAWTGAFIAVLLHMQRTMALLSIFFGVCIAGIIVTLAYLGIIQIAF